MRKTSISKSIKRKSFFLRKKNKKDNDEDSNTDLDEAAENKLFAQPRDDSDTIIFPIRIMVFIHEIHFVSELNKGFLYFEWSIDELRGNSNNVEIRKKNHFFALCL
jgi:hypothetical protein